ncbi:MAG: amidotransferase 1, exosortase A system-associated [Magnetococcales bacterium]|nr:amidotransferase 1, exosortase A system-associated [Magnetococcales bacterium]
MCGIVGLFDCRETRPVAPSLLTRMNDALAHRGPDGAEIRVEPGLGLGHRRLAIIDLEGGHQPMSNEDGSVLLVFNGEIYNFQELYRELVALGHQFKTRSDTEVIVHAWEAWGVACVQRLRGMFAFALWDRRGDALFLARDRLGMKPLYYALLPDGWLGFASEPVGLTTWRPGAWKIAPRAVASYFALGYVPDPEVIFAGVAKLAPGCRLLVRRGHPLPPQDRYWDLTFAPGPPLSPRDAAMELLERLRDSVRLHMIADVPVGSFLSGGIDSSAVALLMAQCATEPPEACTVSFGDPALDESVYASLVAERYGLRHHIEKAEPERFDLLDTLARHYGEPFADPSALPTWLVCALARRHTKVVLSGDGGDESLAGYERYRFFLAEERVRALLPDWVRRTVFAPLGAWYPRLDRAPRWLRARSTLQSLARDRVGGYFQGVAILRDDLRRQLFTPKMQRALQGFRAEETFETYAATAPDHPLSRMQYLDFKSFLAGRVLVKVDRASMAHGLEVRAPLLDYPLVEWLAGLPPEYKLYRGSGKHLLKEGLRPWLPAAILERPKQGFNLPLAAWLRGPLAGRARERILGETLAETGWFNPAFLTRMVDDHQAGRRDFSTALWALLMFEAFLRQMNADDRFPLPP